MPHTTDINTRYAITVSIESQRPGKVIASAHIWRRDSGKQVGSVHFGEGRTLPSAERRAFSAARSDCPVRPPADWDRSSNGDG